MSVQMKVTDDVGRSLSSSPVLVDSGSPVAQVVARALGANEFSLSDRGSIESAYKRESDHALKARISVGRFQAVVGLGAAITTIAFVGIFISIGCRSVSGLIVSCSVVCIVPLIAEAPGYMCQKKRGEAAKHGHDASLIDKVLTNPEQNPVGRHVQARNPAAHWTVERLIEVESIVNGRESIRVQGEAFDKREAALDAALAPSPVAVQ